MHDPILQLGAKSHGQNESGNTMKTQDKPKVDLLFEHWKVEHGVLDRYTVELSEWIDRQSKLRTSQFRETVRKLVDLNEKLLAHFAREEEIGKQIRVAHGNGSPEVDAAKRQCDRDHVNILNRLKHLIDRMQDAESECDAWKKGVYELGLIIDVIEQHEEQESENVTCLLPPVSL